MHQFYSDFSSEEERDDDDIDLWNPNDLIDEILSVEDEEEKLKLKKALLQKFLDQERPLLTSKMKEFFLEDGVTESLMSFVTRVHDDNNNQQQQQPTSTPTKETKQENNSNNNNNNTETAPYFPSLKMRPLLIQGDEDEVKRSFNVMEIFINPMHDLDTFLPEKLHVILRELFKIFSPKSTGNFYHFNKILEQLLIRCPSATTRALLSENLLWSMLDYVNETAIVDTLIETFCIGFPRQSDTIQFYKALVDNKMFERIGEKIYGKPSAIAPSVGEFFVRLMEKLSSIEMSGILFISLCKTPNFIDGLFNVLGKENQYPFAQRQACATVLRELLLKSGQKVFEQVDFTKPLPNMLSAIHDKLHDYAKIHVELCCNILINMDSKKSDKVYELQSYTIKRPFTMYRLILTDILSDLLVCAPETLEKVPLATWRVLSSWFLEYRFNNLYHFHFWKVYQLIIRETNYIEPQKALFVKYKFLSKMIEHYKSSEPSGCRGFILVMCNTLRLAADLQPTSGFLRHFLASHDVWKGFVPKLREDTLLQQKRYDDLIYMPDMGEEEMDEDEMGIDLGSAYARSLGFEESAPLPVPESPKQNKKKKKNKKKKRLSSSNNNNNSDSTSSSESSSSAESSGAEDSGPAQSPDWWKDMVSDFKEQEHKGDQPTNDDWWKGLKDELQSLEGEKPNNNNSNSNNTNNTNNSETATEVKA